MLKAAVNRERESLDDYYVVDTRSNNIREHSFDLEAYARKLGVLREGGGSAMKKYPQIVAAVQAWQAVPWAIADALLKELGLPVNLGSGRCHDDLLTIRDAAEEMLQLGFTGEELGVRQDPDNLLSWRLERWLVKARDVAYQFPPDKAPARLALGSA